MDGVAAQQDFLFRINSKRTELIELFESLVFRSPTCLGGATTRRSGF